MMLEQAGGPPLTVDVLDRDTASQDGLDAAANALFELFLLREKDFDTGDNIFIEYPDMAAEGSDAFRSDPAAYIARRIKALTAGGRAIRSVVVLTTYGDILGPGLRRAGFSAQAIDMPAGPDHTATYRQDLPDAPQDAGLLYVEAVNEADPKIRPAFALLLRDSAGRIVGGACGSLVERAGQRYCYLSTLTVGEGLAPGTGQALGALLITYLRERGVSRIDVGTQTAAPFYEKIGFRIVHTLVPRLRNRPAPGGGVVDHDLAMLSREIR